MLVANSLHMNVRVVIKSLRVQISAVFFYFVFTEARDLDSADTINRPVICQTWMHNGRWEKWNKCSLQRSNENKTRI